MTIELIDDHQDIDVTEGDKAEGEDAQRTYTFGKIPRFVGTKEPGDGFREKPDGRTCDEHRRGDKAERLADHHSERLIITLAYLNRAKRLDGTTGARQEQIIDI